MKSKTSDVKSRFFDIIANPQTSGQGSKSEEIAERHVSMTEKNGKRYRNLAPVFGIGDDDRNDLDGGAGSLMENAKTRS